MKPLVSMICNDVIKKVYVWLFYGWKFVINQNPFILIGSCRMHDILLMAIIENPCHKLWNSQQIQYFFKIMIPVPKKNYFHLLASISFHYILEKDHERIRLWRSYFKKLTQHLDYWSFNCWRTKIHRTLFRILGRFLECQF